MSIQYNFADYDIRWWSLTWMRRAKNLAWNLGEPSMRVFLFSIILLRKYNFWSLSMAYLNASCLNAKRKAQANNTRAEDVAWSHPLIYWAHVNPGACISWSVHPVSMFINKNDKNNDNNNRELNPDCWDVRILLCTCFSKESLVDIAT